MQSMGNEGIFQKNFIKLMEIYVGEKKRWKFSVFRKTSLYGMIFISAYPPFLDEVKNIVFILVVWPGETRQPKRWLWLTVFLQVQNWVNLYVTYCKIRSFYSLFFFAIYFILVYYTLFYLFTHSLPWQRRPNVKQRWLYCECGNRVLFLLIIEHYIELW